MNSGTTETEAQQGTISLFFRFSHFLIWFWRAKYNEMCVIFLVMTL